MELVKVPVEAGRKVRRKSDGSWGGMRVEAGVAGGAASPAEVGLEVEHVQVEVGLEGSSAIRWLAAAIRESTPSALRQSLAALPSGDFSSIGTPCRRLYV